MTAGARRARRVPRGRGLRQVHAADLAATVARSSVAAARFVMLVGLDERVRRAATGWRVEAVAVRPDGGLAAAPGRAARSADPAYPSLTPLVPAAALGRARGARPARDRPGRAPGPAPPGPPRALADAATTRCARTCRRTSRPPDGRPPLRAVRGPRRGRLPAPGRPDPRRASSSPATSGSRRSASGCCTSTRGCSSPIAASRSWSRGGRSRRRLPIVERACGVCTVTHALAYAQAVEALTGTDRPAAGALGAGPARRARAALQPRRRPRQHLRRHRVPVRASRGSAG